MASVVVKHNVTPKLNKTEANKRHRRGYRKVIAERRQSRRIKTAWRSVDHRKTVRNLLLVHAVISVLAIICAHPLILLEAVVVEEGRVIRVLTHSKSCRSDAVQRVHVIGDRRVLALCTRGGHRPWRARVLNSGRSKRHLSGARLAQIYVGRQLGDFTLGFEKTRLQVDDIFTQLVVLAHQGLDLLLEGVDVLHFFLEFANVGFLALAECALF